jgi:hypothetical protein
VKPTTTTTAGGSTTTIPNNCKFGTAADAKVLAKSGRITVLKTTSDDSTCCKPGHGYGDKNHVHCGPPGHGFDDELISNVTPARGSALFGLSCIAAAGVLVFHRRRRL